MIAATARPPDERRAIAIDDAAAAAKTHAPIARRAGATATMPLISMAQR